MSDDQHFKEDDMDTCYYTEYDVTSGDEKALSFAEQFPHHNVKETDQ